MLSAEAIGQGSGEVGWIVEGMINIFMELGDENRLAQNTWAEMRREKRRGLNYISAAQFPWGLG